MEKANTIDVRGLSCPQPVIVTEKAIREGKKPLEILVDSEVAKENILRLANKLGIKAQTKEGVAGASVITLV